MKEVAVYVTGVEPLADMAIDLLRAEGIIARKSINFRELTSYPLYGLGEVEVFVPVSAAPQAIEVLSARFSEMEDDPETDDDTEMEDETENEDEDSESR